MGARAMETLEVRACPAVVFQDDFEGYATAEAFLAVWAEGDPNSGAFETHFGRDSSRSVKLNTILGSLEHTALLPRRLRATDDAPIFFSFDLFLDPSGTIPQWGQSWQLGSLYGYVLLPGSPGARGPLTGVVSMGTSPFSGDPWSASYFQGRVVGDPLIGVVEPTYFTLDGPNAVQRSSGWHSFKAEIRPGSTAFYVDGVLAESQNVGVPGELTQVQLRSAGALEGTMWLDNVRVEQRERVPPGASPIKPANGQHVTLRQMNRRGYIDVRFRDEPGGSGIDPGSVTDADPEFTLSGVAARGVVISGAPEQVGELTFRYHFTGRFRSGSVLMEFSPNAWSDLDGNANGAFPQGFVVTGAFPHNGFYEKLDGTVAKFRRLLEIAADNR